MTKPLSVLLIDDDADIRNMFQMVMEHHQVDFTAVGSAETAFDYLSQHAPNVIILDIFLPGMDGYQALRQIRQQYAPEARIVATTAYYTSDTGRDLEDRGFNGYLLKPVNPTTLIPYLNELVNS